MESRTTDVCEWCKKPMLQATVAEEPKEAPPAQAAAEPMVPDTTPAEAEARPRGLSEGGIRTPELTALGASAAPQVEAAAPLPGDADILRPLGEGPGGKAQSRPGVPSHGLSEEATRTSVDVANYLPPDQALFRPMKKGEIAASTGGIDPLTRRQAGLKKHEAVNPIPDNVRLVRCLVTGVVLNLIVAIAQWAAGQGNSLPEKLLYYVPVGRGEGIGHALTWGIASGALLGGGLGALLVQFKRGPFVGLLAGLLVGYGFYNFPWGLVAGAITGIVVGRLATVGYRPPVGV